MIFLNTNNSFNHVNISYACNILWGGGGVIKSQCRHDHNELSIEKLQIRMLQILIASTQEVLPKGQVQSTGSSWAGWCSVEKGQGRF